MKKYLETSSLQYDNFTDLNVSEEDMKLCQHCNEQFVRAMLYAMEHDIENLKITLGEIANNYFLYSNTSFHNYIISVLATDFSKLRKNNFEFEALEYFLVLELFDHKNQKINELILENQEWREKLLEGKSFLETKKNVNKGLTILVIILGIILVSLIVTSSYNIAKQKTKNSENAEMTNKQLEELGIDINQNVQENINYKTMLTVRRRELSRALSIYEKKKAELEILENAIKNGEEAVTQAKKIYGENLENPKYLSILSNYNNKKLEGERIKVEVDFLKQGIGFAKGEIANIETMLKVPHVEVQPAAIVVEEKKEEVTSPSTVIQPPVEIITPETTTIEIKTSTINEN